MAEDKKGFVLYADLIHTVSQLPNDKAGELFKHILEYVNDNDPKTDDLVINISFEPIKQQLKRDLQKWDNIRKKRSLAGKASAEKRQQDSTKSTHVESVKQVPTDSTVNVNDNVTVNVNVNDTAIKEKVFSDEVKNFTHSILEHFPIKPKKIEDWYKITDQLVTLDKYNYDSIRLIVETFTADGHFWKPNFQSYTKLRKLNKDKIKYCDYFKNILIAKKNGANKGNNKKKQGATIEQLQQVLSEKFD